MIWPQSKGGLLEGVAEVAFADSGYVSTQVKQELLAQDVLLVARPTEAMLDERGSFERLWGVKAKMEESIATDKSSKAYSPVSNVASGCRLVRAVARQPFKAGFGRAWRPIYWPSQPHKRDSLF
jgi:hypothetical protein